MTVQEFPGADDVVVRVQRKGDFRPLYSLQIGRRRKEEPERLMVFIPVKTEGQGTLSVVRESARLLNEALDWITADANQYEDLRIQKMQQRESRDVDRDRGPDRHIGHNGKTQRDKDKKRGGGRQNGTAHGVTSYDGSDEA